jgi:hypothetical protein
MGLSFNSPGTYRIEVSGWGLDSNFFVERTDLLWTPGDKRKVQLHRALAEGAILFIRLLVVESPYCSLPIAYRIAEVEPMDCNGRCLMTLTQLHPRAKESLREKNASKKQGDSKKEGNVLEKRRELRREEVLQ